MKQKLIYSVMFLLVGLPFVAFAAVSPYSNYHIPIPIEKMKPYGEYGIIVFDNNVWREVGSFPFDNYFRERTIDLNQHLPKDKQIRIRLVQRGGGAAHIDSVLLGEKPPTNVVGIEANTVLAKLSRKDFEIIDASGKTFEFIFPKNIQNKSLKITARVESEIPDGVPFQFPLTNLYKKIDGSAKFYNYKLHSRKAGNLKTTESFFKEFCRSGTGHPDGYTYGWVWNDKENLYTYIDFTGDNTNDGAKDFAKVYVNTGKELKEFNISGGKTQWGYSDFVYTDKVNYQHKVFQFKIPMNEIGISEGSILLSFAAYGTNGAPPKGACCIEDEEGCSCSVLTEAECLNEKGEYKGHNTKCEEISCDQTPPHLELEVKNSVDPDPVAVGGELTYSIQIFVDDCDTELDVVINDTLPVGVTFFSADESCKYDDLNHEVECIDTVAANETTIFEITVIPNEEGELSNTVTVTATDDGNNQTLSQVTVDTTAAYGTNGDPSKGACCTENCLCSVGTQAECLSKEGEYKGDNTACEEISCDQTPPHLELELKKSVDPDPVTVGGELTYSIQIFVDDCDTELDIVINDTLPVGVTFFSADESCKYDDLNHEVECIDTVAANETTIFEITVIPNEEGVLSNTVTVTATDNGNNQTQSQATIDTTVEATEEDECHCDADGAIKGTPGRDFLFGTHGPDIICGFEGNDIIFGLGGDDCIDGGKGKDMIYGGRGYDTIFGGEGKDRIFGGKGDDTISGGEGNDKIFGGKGDDTIDGGEGKDRIFGGKGDDTIRGGEGNDKIFSGKGDDTIDGGEGFDIISGGRDTDDCVNGERVYGCEIMPPP